MLSLVGALEAFSVTKRVRRNIIIMKLFWAFLAVIGSVNALELTEQSPESIIVPQGGEISLFCSSDEDFDFCTWTHVESEIECSISRDESQEQDTSCSANDRLQWDVDSAR